MTPLPKRRLSKGRSRRRRSHHALSRAKLTECPTCHNMRLPHHVCLICGSYRGTSVIEVEE